MYIVCLIFHSLSLSHTRTTLSASVLCAVKKNKDAVITFR